jgi:AraC-like DNA-binding protein
MTSGLLASLERLLAVAQDPIRHKVFEAPSLREVVFELLVGPEGPGLRKALSRRGGLSAVIDVARYIDEHSHERIRMPTMARRAAMRQSAVFAKFREATGATPLQYLERLRLTKGRVLLSLGASSVAEVAYTVGYASGAQFSRDFLVAFGVSPSAVLRSSRG